LFIHFFSNWPSVAKFNLPFSKFRKITLSFSPQQIRGSATKEQRLGDISIASIAAKKEPGLSY
jgi:hypothetical protein